MFKLKTLKLKIGIISILILLAISSVTFELYKWTTSYASMEKQMIQNFDSIWSQIWNKETQTFNEKLNQNMIQTLEQYATTPTYMSKLKLAKSSVNLNIINHTESTLIQIISAANDYYANINDDNDFKEQQQKNEDTVANIETLINQINDNNEALTINNKEFTLENITDNISKLNEINSSINLKDLKTYNNNIKSLKDLVEKQINENDEKIKEQNIIDLKQKLDEFLTQSKQYEKSIKNNYINVSDLKKILKTLNESTTNVNESYFSNLEGYQTSTQSKTYETKFNKSYFDKYKNLENYKAYLEKINIKVNLSTETSNVKNKNDEAKSQTLKMEVNTSVTNENDNDLVNIESLANINVNLYQNQTIKIYTPIREPLRETTTSEPSTPTTSTQTDVTSTERIPIRRTQ